MKFLTKKVFSLGTIIGLHVNFSVVLIMAWTIIKRGWDFSVTSFSNESFYMAGGRGRFNIAAVVIGALFKYLHFNHLTFYLFNILLSSFTIFVFFNLARTCLNRRHSLYLTAIFAFNPEFTFYNNFVLKENMLIMVIIIAMYFFFKALTTDLLTYKVVFCLLLPLIFLVREPLVLMSFLPLALLPKSQRKLVVLSGIAIACVLLYMSREQCVEMLKNYMSSHLGNYGITKALLENIYGVPTLITFGELFSSPALFAGYFLRSFLRYIRPGWSQGVKLNLFLIPYTLFVVYVFIASLPYRKFLTSTYRTAYFLIALIIILVSLVIIIYDPVVRYRYSVYQLGFVLLVLNLRGYQECTPHRSHATTTKSHAIVKYATV
ncbi:MAG: glycosyltransferase family 39 protein [Phycisphaerales bacterium]|jgi:hypothetical protein